ncbi:MAG: DNA polymerase III subunit gamma/tau [Bacteroidetes bacterium]|nr:DNA polymerase III subunit gamma/tau [Bacteroidota bacterium]MBS1972976.1 DNA polymerase III subunit gamma/tau [Bacteroidota bacterium]
MDKFIVSARKYRPQNFSTVVGQPHITTTLKNAIKNNQLAHAFLFCGPRGVGKTTCARILAKTINCENRGADAEACNKCTSCISFNEGTSLNIHELDAASNNSVDDIRTLVEQVRFAPQAGKYKVYIIDEVHMLTAAAFNAFLKTLEEPPPYAIFILATTEKHKILPTILSRCQIFDFKRITVNDTVEHLREICDKEEIKADKAALQVIAQRSEGCMRDALSILDKIASFTNNEISYQDTLEHLNILDADYYFRLMEAMQQQNLAGALLLFDDINKKGFEGDMVLNGFAEFIRNLLVCKDEKVALLLEAVENFKERYVDAAKKISASYLISALNLLNETEINYKAARNKRLHVELALIKLCYLQQAIEISANSEGISKKKSTEASKPVAFRSIVPVEAQRKKEKQEIADKPGTVIDGHRAKLLIETSSSEEQILVQEATKDYAQPVQQAVKTTPVATLGALSKLRKEVAGRQQSVVEEKTEKLDDAILKKAWMEYAQQLRMRKNPAVQSFELAVLRIIDDHSFEAMANNNLEQKFIEQEKRDVSAFLQKFFNNRSVTFNVTVNENKTIRELVGLPLNKKEQYLKIIAHYPLVKELKDRLRLELDY